MQGEVSLNEIPNIIEASNFENLRLLMLATNVRLGSWVKYEVKSPNYKGDKWRAVYYEKMDTKKIIIEQLKGK